MEKIIHAQKTQYYGINDPDKLLEDINNNLKPKNEEKKERGEVFTPISLVKEMLNKLPSSVWNNPDLKWLDPAVGIGNYPIIVYLNLMKGLEVWEPDEEKRKKHILENMLYMVEISDKSILILNKIFCGIDGGGIYKINIHAESFLEDKYNDKFDIIIGNPPYNHGGVAKGGGPLWPQFVHKSLELLNDDGYLCMIHPPGWRKPIGERASAGDIWNKFKKYNLIYLKIDDTKIKHFPRVDYYVLHKSDNKTETHIDNSFENNTFNGRLNIHELSLIPHFVNKDVLSVFNKLFNKSGDKFYIIRNQSFKPASKDNEITIGKPHAHMWKVESNDYVIIYKNYSDIDFNKINKDNYFNKKKIVMTYNAPNKSANLYPKYYDSMVGTTANTMYKIIEESDNKNNIMFLLNSKLIHCILKLTQYSEAPNKKNEFKILNMITKPNEGIINNEEELYKFYGISSNEQKIIEKLVENSYMKKSNPRNNSVILNKTIKKEKKDDPPSKATTLKKSINEFKQPEETDPKYQKKYEECIKQGKLWNLQTKRCIVDNEHNRRKLTIKKKDSPKSNTSVKIKK